MAPSTRTACRDATLFFWLDVISYSSAIIAFEKGGKWKRDVCQGKGNGEGGEGGTFERCERTFFVSQRERTGKPEKPPWHHALGMLVRMRHHDVLLDVLNYNSTLRACDKGWQWHQALGLLVGMRHFFFG